jgi:hypothetical protein
VPDERDGRRADAGDAVNPVRDRAGGTAVLLGLLGLGLLAWAPVLVHRGYVLLGDMVFVPDQPWKPAWLGLDGSVPRAVPADALVSVASTVVPGDVLQKGVLFGVVVLAGLGVARVAGRHQAVNAAARFGGGVLYAWNPFVFERLAIGHWGLLVGYAVLPWVLDAALDVRRGGSRTAGRLVLLLAIAAAGSPTGGLVAGALTLVVVAERHRLRRLAVVLGAVVAVNLPWLAAAVLNNVGTSDDSGVAAFAARSDTELGTGVSLLTLGGIWKRAVVPAERDATLLVVATLVVVIASLVAVLRAARRSGTAAWLPGRLALVGGAALLVAAVPATGPGERWATDLVGSVPGLGLWRDSQKWLMPLALVTALGFALVLDAFRRVLDRIEFPARVVSVAAALLPVVLLPSLAWGLSGRLEAVRYPSEWYDARATLADQPSADRRTAVLPWSAYQRLPWNGNRAALDPASRFFPGDVVVSDDLVLGERETVRGADRSAARIGRALASGAQLGPVLAREGVRYLLVERTAPSDATPRLPDGQVLHDGPELLLLDLGHRGRPARAAHGTLILLADAVTVAVLLAAIGALVVGRTRGRNVRYDARGSNVTGGDDAAGRG